MKVKKALTSRIDEKKLSKDLCVKLTRLSKETIRRYLISSFDPNCMLYLNIKDGKVLKVQHSGTKIPMTITVNSTISKPDESANTYNLRKVKKKEEEEEKKALKKCTAVAIIGTAVRKNQLWSLVKKDCNKAVLIEGAVVFGKQVSLNIFYYFTEFIKRNLTLTLFDFNLGGLFTLAG